MFPKEFVIEDGVVYYRKKPLHKQPLFWTTIAGGVISLVLGILVLILLFFIGASEINHSDYAGNSNEYYEDLSTYTDYEIGETVEFGDGLKVTVQSMKEDSAVELVDTYYSKALVVDLVVENTLDEEFYFDEYNQLELDLQTYQNELTQLQQQLASLPQTPPSTTVSASNGVVSIPTEGDETGQRAELNTKISEVTAKIETIKSSISGKESEIEGQESSIREMERSYNDPTSQAYNTYAQLISELGTARSANNKSITELEANLGIATGQDQSYKILATSDGVLHYVIPLKEGISVQQNQTVAEVAGEDKDSYVEAYVVATDISRVNEGARVDIALSGVNSQKYGTLKGKVRQIDSGTITQETKEGNLSLYKVIVELETLSLKKDNETIFLQKDMPVEARIVYDKESYLDWLLELLSFKQ